MLATGQVAQKTAFERLVPLTASLFYGKRFATKEPRNFGAGVVNNSMTIQLATSLIFLISTFYGPAPVENATVLSGINFNESKKEVAAQSPITLEEYIKDYFKDDPVLAEIAKCESTYRQFRKDGKVIRGKVNPSDVGIMQINEIYHADRAEKLGFDIYTLEGNIAYAKWLYEKEGVKPWGSSSKCWASANNEVATASGDKSGKQN